MYNLRIKNSDFLTNERSKDIYYLYSFFLVTVNCTLRIKHSHTLHMIRMRKHIHRSHFERLIPAILKHPQVSCKRAWIAGYVHHPLRFHVDDCPQEGFVATFSWRVDDEGVGRDAFFIPFRNDGFRFSDCEFCVCDAVQLSVAFCILDGFRHDFDAVYFLRLLRQK